MTTPLFRYILFDLGGTLMHAKSEWDEVYERADEALTRVLHGHKIALDSKIFRARLHNYYTQREQDLQETSYHFILRELLKEMGYAEVEETVLRSALDAMYSITQTNWVLEEDALVTLQQLKSKNYQLGILSNAGDDKDVQQLVEGFGIRPHFDFVLTSANCFYRKPHQRAFELALAHWNVAPEEAVMIGDSLEADIQGAKNLRMKSIWLTRRAQFKADEIQRFKPDFSMRSLKELPPTLERISTTRI